MTSVCTCAVLTSRLVWGAPPPRNAGVKGEGPTGVGPACGALDPGGRRAAHASSPPAPTLVGGPAWRPAVPLSP